MKGCRKISTGAPYIATKAARYYCRRSIIGMREWNMKFFFKVCVASALFFNASAYSAENIYFFHNDHLGSPQEITDIDQSVVWEIGDDPFSAGVPVTEQVSNNIRFPGQYYDEESDLHYNWNRYYDPELGRYITSDPIGMDGGMNTFSYVNSNPLRYVDPNGLEIFNKPIRDFLRKVTGFIGKPKKRAACRYRRGFIGGIRG
jgi:RHS repeat-associated protein